MNKIKLFLFLIIIIMSCKKEDIIVRTINDSMVSDDLKINEIQVIGSHNSYRKMINPELFEFLETLSPILPEEFALEKLDYTHPPLQDQFYDYGVRQIELDLYLDPQGGLFYNRKGNEMIGDKPASGIKALQEPGLKIMHIPDIDYETHYLTFKDALRDIKNFSDNNPSHLPINIMLELKKETINDFLPDLGFAKAITWSSADFDILEQEILSVLSQDEILIPDDVRKGALTLRQAVIDNGWPTVAESRGKVIFSFINSKDQNNLYKQNAPSLENKLIFTNADIKDDDAAFLKYDDPIVYQDSIKIAVNQGFLVRTRSDSGTEEARTGDYSKWNAALSNGAQYISTDYYKPDYRSTSSSEWTNFSVGFDNGLYQTNQLVP